MWNWVGEGDRAGQWGTGGLSTGVLGQGLLMGRERNSVYM